jgi:hypothetical protein
VLLHVQDARGPTPIIAPAVRHLNTRIRHINALLATLLAKLAPPLPQTIVNLAHLILNSAWTVGFWERVLFWLALSQIALNVTYPL